MLKITILDIFDYFDDCTTKNKIRHTRGHKLQPNIQGYVIKF